MLSIIFLAFLTYKNKISNKRTLHIFVIFYITNSKTQYERKTINKQNLNDIN